MNIIIKCFFLIWLIVIKDDAKDYKYMLICTSKNCAPCVQTADEFMAKNNIRCIIINLFQNKAEKQSSDELIARLCSKSKSHRKISKKEKYCFGMHTFISEEAGPFFIKYSKKDTIIYNATNIEDVNN